MSADVSEAVAKALSALNRVLPVSVTETPDYAELVFGESKTQAMTLEPQTWLALNELPAILAALQECTQPSRSDILERIRAYDFEAHYTEPEYESLADDLEALAQPNQPRDREEG